MNGLAESNAFSLAMEMVVSLATDRLNNILIELPKYKSQWQLNVASPYVRAYDLAIDNFQRTTKAQQARDKMIAELFVLSASILTGSVMMAAFATSSLRVLTSRAALRVICNNNLNRTFDAMHAANNNKVLMFALGGVLDEAKKAAGKQITSAVEGLTSSSSIASAPTALNFLTRVEDFINTNHICVHKFVQGVRDDGSISDASKTHLADLVAKTPFCNPPESRRVDENRLSQKMELLFYMDAVMESDKLVSYIPGNGGMYGPSEIELSKKSIPELTSSPGYPQSTVPRLKGGFPMRVEPGQRVEYDGLGSVVSERVNRLHSQILGQQFFPPQSTLASMVSSPSVNKEQVAKAERVIGQLGVAARPQGLADIKML